MNLHRAVRDQFHLQAVIDAVRAGADLSAADAQGQTPLHAAIAAVGTGCTTPTPAYTLVALGAEVNAPDHQGRTPLHLACASGKEDLVAMLLAAGADPSVPDAEGRLPRADVPDKTNIHGARAAILGWLENQPLPPPRELIPAVAGADAQAAVLLRNGADPNTRDNSGNRLLHHGKSPWVIAALLALGADPNARNRAGQTPLHHACTGIGGAIQLLLDNGADPNLADRKGRLAVEALEAQHYEPDFYDGDRLQSARDHLIARVRARMRDGSPSYFLGEPDTHGP